MPFESEKQRRWMHANEPEMAKRWEKKEEALKQEGSGPTAATIRMPAEKITSTVSGTPDWEQAFLEYESAEQDSRRFPDPGLLQRLEDVVGEDWREDYDEWKEHPHRAEPLKPSQPGPLISEEDSGMKIKGLELERIIREQLRALLGEGGFAGHYLGPNLVTAAGDTPEDIAKEMLESGQEITEETVTQAALDAGVLDDDLPDFIDAIIDILQDEDWESQVWKDAAAQGGAQRPSHRPQMMDATNPSAVVSKSSLKEAVKEALLSEMGCGGGHHGHGHEQPSVGGMNDLLALGGGQSQTPLIIIQTSEEEQEGPAVTHPTHIRHKQQAPEVSGLEQLIPMLLQLEGQVVSFSSRELESHVKRSLKRILRERKRR